MAQRPIIANIDLHLVKVLYTVISERSVSRAAMRLQSTQPMVSAQLKRLRELTGDPLLVRSGQGLAPTDAALAMLEPAARLLREAETLFSPRQRSGPFDPASADIVLRIAASDYLDPLFLPRIVELLKREAPLAQVELHPLSAEIDYRRKLAAGDVDLVIGNWLQPPEELHLSRLMSDEIVCLVAPDHPAATARGARNWTVERYLQSEHVAPMAFHSAAPGVIDQYLAAQGLERKVVVRSAHFSLIPLMVARSWLVLTTGRLFCSRYADALGLRIVRCPVPFPPLSYYQLWHERSHAAPPLRWLRERVRDVARDLSHPRSGFAAPPRGGDGSEPAEPDPRRPLGNGSAMEAVRQGSRRGAERR
ncbi:MAG TPA: LysR family transcriptional regulator [Rubrivivax sp.]|nr:LysR family transcriptional regulator [Rubrivivax sp.]